MRRNISIIKYNIEGKEESQWASSGSQVYPGAISGPANNPYFKAIAVYDPQPFLRNQDSEYRLLNWLAEKLNTNGLEECKVIDLYTEREPCISCQGVISQFESMFPNITLNVISWHEGNK